MSVDAREHNGTCSEVGQAADRIRDGLRASATHGETLSDSARCPTTDRVGHCVINAFSAIIYYYSTGAHPHTVDEARRECGDGFVEGG